jgi:hypothetical protein
MIRLLVAAALLAALLADYGFSSGCQAPQSASTFRTAALR